MRNFILLLFMVVSVNSFSQKIGDFKIENSLAVRDVPDLANYYEKWMNVADIYTMKFKQNAMGVKHAIEQTNAILLRNGLFFSKPTNNKNFIASFVKDIYDYENLYLSISTGGSEISMAWDIQGTILMLHLKEDAFRISIVE